MIYFASRIVLVALNVTLWVSTDPVFADQTVIQLTSTKSFSTRQEYNKTLWAPVRFKSSASYSPQIAVTRYRHGESSKRVKSRAGKEIPCQTMPEAKRWHFEKNVDNDGKLTRMLITMVN